MKVCPNCQTKYPDDANFCPQEACATPDGPRRLVAVAEESPPPRYQMQVRIGGTRGGEVWRALDTQTNNLVAYKLVAPAVLPTPTAVERALRELKQLTRAQNPHILKVLDFGKNPDGRVFVVMELVTATPLDQLVRQGGPLPLDRAKKICAQIGEALLEGQKVGVIHHDLAAKNVLCGAADDVKLINFPTPRPLSDTVFGVADYVSPEQAEGKLVDQRSNTYNLGALLMLMLTGEPPFTGPDEQAVLQSVLHDELVPPSRRNPALSADLDRLVGKALERNSSRRPLTLRQFLNDVAGLTAPIGATPGSTGGVSVPAARPDAPFAKTMMFAGGSPEVQKLVAEAAAARAEANGSGGVAAFAPPGSNGAGAPAPSEAAASAPADDPLAEPTPATTTSRRHGAAVSATIVAMPSKTPPPVAAASATGGAPETKEAASADASPEAKKDSGPAKAASAPGPNPNFRETLWFKKGDVDQMVADAKAKATVQKGVRSATPTPPAGETVLGVDENKPLEDRYVDDGSVTVEDRKKFSLRSGGTASSLKPVGLVPGARMSEAEMLDEIGGRKRMTIIVGAAAVGVALIVVLVVALRGGKGEDKPAVPAAPAATAPAEPATPPAAAAPAAPAPATGAPSEGAGPDATKEPAKTHVAVAKKKAVVAKKKAPPPKKKK
ncbi:MAG TPA: protein kinase [Polyangia bacterium]|nr:protein kinase [Polyangia bacterium]